MNKHKVKHHRKSETWEVALAEITTPSEVSNITEDNNFFFLAFPDQHSLYMKFGVENITEMCSNENGDCYKLRMSTDIRIFEYLYSFRIFEYDF